MPSHAIPSPLLRARPPAPSAAAAAATGRRAPSRVVAALGGGGPAGRGMEQQQQLAGDGSRSPVKEKPLVSTIGKSTNILWHNCPIGQSERQNLLGQKGCVIWITGLSGSVRFLPSDNIIGRD
uniref:Adenosine-5'-phosphosulfate kinase, putative n=1 Tax=Oryza sativa subsp. japonica TaxID=39947 RepID=Q10QB8_ORYSJ|nr:adenosine-5'-phosphosulfate kinase, putative [Oryza sativa Japonica Group]